MMWLLLGALSASAADPSGPETPADPTYDRLFAEPAIPTPEPPVAEGPTVPMWVWPASLLGLGLAGAMHLRRSVRKAAPVGMKILDRQATGDRSTLLVVEVSDGTGERRRLLIGTGNGAPTLVADLGVAALDAHGATSGPADARTGGPRAEPDRTTRASFATRLAAEILAERGAPRPAASDPTELDAELDAEDQRDRQARATARARFFSDEDLAPPAPVTPTPVTPTPVPAPRARRATYRPPAAPVPPPPLAVAPTEEPARPARLTALPAPAREPAAREEPVRLLPRDEGPVRLVPRDEGPVRLAAPPWPVSVGREPPVRDAAARGRPSDDARSGGNRR